MDQLIPIFNRLQQVIDAAQQGEQHHPIHPHQHHQHNSRRLASLAVELPTIVVIGSQSSGKSSVLEGLVGRDFLPRGKDIVTRRPLVLQLYHQPVDSFDYAVFGHKPDQKYTDFAMVKREIEAETERVAGRGKAISKLPIQLSIYSCKLLPLTLVDLPGITKIPVADQPANIEQQIRDLVLEYASRPNALLLAITPANSDLANSDALKVTREVDPSGQRTIGVLTKLDLMDAGTNALDILQNRGSFRLKHGFVGLVLRSQQDINQGIMIAEALEKERQFFKNHQQYRSLRASCGIRYLAEELNKILLQYIKAALPDIRSTINGLLLSCQAELMSYGEGEGERRQHLLLRLVTLYVTDFQESIQGTSKSMHTFPTDELIGGARLLFIFNNEYGMAVGHMTAADDLSLDQVRTAIRNSSGPRPAIFVPEGSFEVLIKRQIQRLEHPAVKCVEAVYDELHRLLSQTSRIELKRFPHLTAKMMEVSAALLKERLQPTCEMVENLVKIEQSYINTSHPDFMSAGPAFQAVLKVVEERRRKDLQMRLSQSSSTSSEDAIAVQQILPSASTSASAGPPNNNNLKDGGLFSYLFKSAPQPPPSPTKTTGNTNTPITTRKRTALATETGGEPLSEREEFETQLIMTLLHGYFAIVKRNLMDTVPKACMHFLVNTVMEQLPSRLVAELYKEDLFSELLREDENIVKQRQRCRRDLDALQSALQVLGELRDV